MRFFRLNNHSLPYRATLLFIIASMAITGPGMAYAKQNQPKEKVFSKSMFAKIDGDRENYDGDGDWDNIRRSHRYNGYYRACSNTTRAAFKACLNEVRDDAWITLANCQNISAADEKAECVATAADAFQEARRLCSEQRHARTQVCERLGEAPYDPDIYPDMFIDFEAVVDRTEQFFPNPYWPLVPGTTYEYVVKDAQGNQIEQTKMEVTQKTIEILGINCIVVRDRVWAVDEDGTSNLIEDTDDWYAQDKQGNVWYFGEEVKDYENGVLISIDGSFQAGRGFDKAGMIMLAHPQAGDYYRQEFSLGNAEDVSENLEIIDTLTVGGVTYHDVLKAAETIPIEPDVLDYKFFAPGVGLIMSENLDGERLELKQISTPKGEVVSVSD